MEYMFICYKGCSTCSKAKKLLADNNVTFTEREITEEIPTAAELSKWIELSGLDIKSFFNTRGASYRELNLKERYDELSKDEKLELLSNDGMLLKRPILVSDDKVLLGFNEKAYQDIL